MAIYEKHLEMNTCVIWPFVVSNWICQTRVRLVHNLYESKHHWAQSWLPGNFIMGLSRFSLPDFPHWSLQLHPISGGKGFCFQAVLSFCIYFSLLFLSQAKSSWKIREKVPVRACQIPLPFCQMFYELSYLRNWINFHSKHSSCIYLGNTVVKNDSCIPYRTIPQ